MAKHRRVDIAGIYRATLKFLTCSHVILTVIRAMAASVSTPQTLARKWSKGYAPRIVAGRPDTTTSEDEHGTAVNETGACFVPRSISSMMHSRRAKVALNLKGKPRKVTPALAAPPPAKVSRQIKLPVIDAKLLISSSKVQPLLSNLHEVPCDILSSVLALLGVGTILP